MFSVNNFYDFLNSHYGWAETQVMLWKFQWDGSKNFYDLQACYDKTKFLSQRHYWNIHGSMILHDQEPFTADSVNTYRNTLAQRKNQPFWLNFNRREILLSMPHQSCSWPIFCHSESNSQDIDFIRYLGMIDCYYFWHGLVSRDWFRHWRHHADFKLRSNWDQRFLLYARDFSGSREYRRTLIDHLRPFQQDVQYNWSGSDVVTGDYSAKISTLDMRAAVHIVAETVFDQNKIHLTEKVFKPMVMLQPFVLFAGAGSLQYLKNYGFRTFDSVWDEGYDSEIDHKVRMARAVSVIQTLQEKSSEEFSLIMKRCQSIVEHNRTHFYSQQFEDILLDELHKNIRGSILQQHHRTNEDPGGAFFHALDSIQHTQSTIPISLQHHARKTLKMFEQFKPIRYNQILDQYTWINSIR
jgi:hypothetical protein